MSAPIPTALGSPYLRVWLSCSWCCCAPGCVLGGEEGCRGTGLSITPMMCSEVFTPDLHGAQPLSIPLGTLPRDEGALLRVTHTRAPLLGWAPHHTMFGLAMAHGGLSAECLSL